MNQTNLAKIYEEIAESYIEIRDSMQITNEIHALRDRLSESNPKILDAGCGPGRDLETFNELECNTFGVDITKKFVDIAKTRNPQSHISVGDIRNLKFENCFFDAIWSCAVLSHIEKEFIPSVISEFFRVLKPDGYISILVREGYGFEFVEDDFKGVKRFFVNYQADEFIEYLENAGFEMICFSSFNEKERFGERHRNINYLYFKAKKTNKLLNIDS